MKEKVEKRSTKRKSSKISKSDTEKNGDNSSLVQNEAVKESDLDPSFIDMRTTLPTWQKKPPSKFRYKRDPEQLLLLPIKYGLETKKCAVIDTDKHLELVQDLGLPTLSLSKDTKNFFNQFLIEDSHFETVEE